MSKLVYPFNSRRVLVQHGSNVGMPGILSNSVSTKIQIGTENGISGVDSVSQS